MRKAFSVSTIAEATRTALGAATFLVLAAGLGPTPYGQYVQYAALAAILLPMASVGLNWWIQPFSRDTGPTGASTAVTAILLVAGAITSLIAPLASHLLGWNANTVLAVAFTEAVVYPIWSFLGLALLALGRLRGYLLVSVVIPAVKLCCSLVVILIMGASLQVWGWVTAAVGLGGLSITVLAIGLPRLSATRYITKEWLRRGVSYATVGFASSTTDNIDRFMLGLTLSPAQIGPYGVATKLSSYGAIPSRAIALVTYPEYFELARNREHIRIRSLMRATIRTSLLPSVAMSLLVVVSAIVLQQFLLQDYDGLVASAAILAVLIPVRAFQYAAGDALYALDHPTLRLIATIIGAVLTGGLVYALSTQWGLIGAAVGLTLSVTLVTCFMYGIVYRILTQQATTSERDQT